MSLERVKDSFRKRRERQFSEEFLSGVHFFAANDNFSLVDDAILIKSDPLELKEQKQSSPIVNLFVADSDIFSIIGKIEGDIIICDIDEVLLNFIEEQRKYLLALYDEWQSQKKSFDTIRNEMLSWASTEKYPRANSQIRARARQLAGNHYSNNPLNFERSIQALKTKNFITLNINLFNKQEQSVLCDELKKEKRVVKIFHLTNLPDYDKDNNLLFLLNQLPWHEKPQIIWNIHDRGPLIRDYSLHNVHYLFCATATSEYLKHLHDRPKLFGKIDRFLFRELVIEAEEPSPLRAILSEKNMNRYCQILCASPPSDLHSIYLKYSLKVEPVGRINPIYLTGSIDDMGKVASQFKEMKIPDFGIDGKSALKQLENSMDETTQSMLASKEEKRLEMSSFKGYRIKIKVFNDKLSLISALVRIRTVVYSQQFRPSLSLEKHLISKIDAFLEKLLIKICKSPLQSYDQEIANLLGEIKSEIHQVTEVPFINQNLYQLITAEFSALLMKIQPPSNVQFYNLFNAKLIPLQSSIASPPLTASSVNDTTPNFFRCFNR